MSPPEKPTAASPEAAPSRDAAHDAATKGMITIVPTIRVGGRIRNLWAHESPEDTVRWTAEARVRQGIR